FIAVCISIYLVENEHEIDLSFTAINAMLSAALGIPLFFCINVFSQKLNLQKKTSILLQAGGAIILGLLYFSLPNSEQTANTSLPYIRYAIYNIALHLLVSFAPYLKGKQLNGFWQYNRVLFTRLILSVVYSGFLYAGIALAMGALQVLFDVDINGETYFELFIFIAGFFNTWFFVAGMPTNFDELDKIEHYPFGLKVFSQYILLPLLLMYLVILYMYGGKIIALWDWPKGVVSWLIVAVSVLGIFTFLLIHPFGQKEENSWIKKFTKIYYFLVIPLVVLLFLAISIRLSDYGITINRYIIVLLGIWLTLVSGYFIIGKNNIKFIPISLCVMMLLMSFGPWGMFSVSERSQANRLEQLLTNHGILKDGKIVNEQTITIDSNYYKQEFKYPNSELVNDSINNEIKSIIDYMNDFHGFNAVKDWYKTDYDIAIKNYNKEKERWNRINEAELFMRALGLQYRHRYSSNNHKYFSYSATHKNKVTDIKNYDYLINIDHNYNYNNNNRIYPFKAKGLDYTVVSPRDSIFNLSINQGKNTLITLSLKELKDSLIKKYDKNYTPNLPQDELTISLENENIACKFIIRNISFNTSNNKVLLDNVYGKLLLKVKD
ncbi:MAG: DUF4153 domain-containing protein, partial [Vicingaceae bacterium]